MPDDVADSGERGPLTQRVRGWLFGCTEMLVGTIEADIPPAPAAAGELGRRVLDRVTSR